MFSDPIWHSEPSNSRSLIGLNFVSTIESIILKYDNSLSYLSIFVDTYSKSISLIYIYMVSLLCVLSLLRFPILLYIYISISVYNLYKKTQYLEHAILFYT